MEKELKTCGVCKKDFPKTLEFFHKRLIKQFNKAGELRIYESFKYCCKTCYNVKLANLQKEKYWKDPEKARGANKIKYWKDPETCRERKRTWAKKNRECVLEKDRKRVRELDDSWVASLIGLPLSEIPKEVLETKKLLLQLKREIKKNKPKTEKS